MRSTIIIWCNFVLLDISIMILVGRSLIWALNGKSSTNKMERESYVWKSCLSLAYLMAIVVNSNSIARSCRVGCVAWAFLLVLCFLRAFRSYVSRCAR